MGTASKEAQKRMDLLDEKARERFIPLNAQLELTSDCNLKCVHCYIARDEKKRELSFAEIINLLDQLADAGCLWLNLTGGEALTRLDFFDIAHYARKKHFAVRIFTNATLIDEAAAHKIAQLSPLSVEISIYGVNPATHDAITRVSGSFERTMQAVKMLCKENLRVVMKTVLMKKNIFEVEDIFRWCRNLGLEHQFDVQICPRNDGSPEPTIYQLDDDELKDYFLKDIPERIEYEKEEVSVVAGQKPTCSPATNTCGISS
jgi:MoaA/NifB/PqqE/SkfB family radical SAM enzyme